jgi:hypothetical protein
MKYLETLFAGQDAVRLAADPAEVQQQVQAALKGRGVGVKLGNKAGDPGPPTGVLRRFLPPEEGGVDTTHPMERWEYGLVPWNYFPPQISRRFRTDVEPGRRLREAFQQQFLGLLLAPRQPRDLLLRGRLDEATTMLAPSRDQLQQYKTVFQDEPDLAQQLDVWFNQITEAYAELMRAERGARDPALAGPARDKVREAWQAGEQPLSALIRGASAEPLGGMATYFLALCKHEQAERLQLKVDQSGAHASEAAPLAREAWKGASEWWGTFLSENTSAVGTPNARLLAARALEALGQRAAAAAMLRDLSGGMTPLDQTGRLYRARQLAKP